MKPFETTNREDVIPLLQEGKIGVMPTDTVYGLVSQARDPNVVDRLYAIKGRGNKPVIVLIASSHDITNFGIELNQTIEKQLKQYWPGPVSIILPLDPNLYTHLHQGVGSLAFRVPNDPALQKLLQQTGPLVATSANKEAQPTATTIEEAQTYFGDEVDFYVDGGAQPSPASTLIRLTRNGIEVLRPGQGAAESRTQDQPA